MPGLESDLAIRSLHATVRGIVTLAGGIDHQLSLAGITLAELHLFFAGQTRLLKLSVQGQARTLPENAS